MGSACERGAGAAAGRSRRVTDAGSPGRHARRALAIAAETLAVQNGILMAFAVLYLPLVGEFGGSRGEVATVRSGAPLLGGFSGPLVGWAFDRLGPRRLCQGGAVLGALALALASRVDSLALLVLTYGVLGGLALAALGSQGNMIVAALWYPGARGRAIAVADLGTGFGAFCFIPLGQALVSALGWRATLLVWASLLLLIVLPLSAFQRLPGDGHAGRLAPREPPAAWTVAGAIRSRPFWWLAATRFFSAFAFPVMYVHMVAYAIDQGLAPARAATALGAVCRVSLAARLTTGVLRQRRGRAETLTITYASAAAGIGCLVLLR